MLLRKCNGKVIDSENITSEQILTIYNESQLVDNDFECEEGNCTDGHDCIVRIEIDQERECKDFNPCSKSF